MTDPALARRALLELERLTLLFEPDLFAPSGPAPRLRVTRRGNVYDDVERRTVWYTWGLGSIKERCVLAQKYIDERTTE